MTRLDAVDIFGLKPMRLVHSIATPAGHAAGVVLVMLTAMARKIATIIRTCVTEALSLVLADGVRWGSQRQRYRSWHLVSRNRDDIGLDIAAVLVVLLVNQRALGCGFRRDMSLR